MREGGHLTGLEGFVDKLLGLADQPAMFCKFRIIQFRYSFLPCYKCAMLSDRTPSQRSTNSRIENGPRTRRIDRSSNHYLRQPEPRVYRQC
jgi:hypothetical protein